MAEYNEEALEELFDDSHCEPNEGMLARLVEAVQVCDAHGNIPLALRLRSRLIHHATFSGQGPRALVAVGWILAQVDRDPSLEELLIYYGRNHLMWYQKWIVLAAVDMPNVSRQQIDGLLADMARRYTERGLSLATVEYMTMCARRGMGDLPAMREHYERWRALPADAMSDCRACVVNAVVRMHLTEGALEKAIEHARPVLQGNLSCMSVPAITFAKLLLPLVKAGRLAEADRYQRRGQRNTLARSADMLDSVGEHIKFLALTDQCGRARRMLTQTLAKGVASPEAGARWDYLLGVWTLLEKLRASGQTAIELKLADPLPVEHRGARYPISLVLDWCRNELETVGAQFDARNGNNVFEQEFADVRDLAKLSYPLPE